MCVVTPRVRCFLCAVMPMPRQLYWGSRNDPCHSLTTEGDLPDITVEEWFHVGLTLSGGIDAEGSAIIYVNGVYHGSSFVLRECISRHHSLPFPVVCGASLIIAECGPLSRSPLHQGGL